MEIVTSENMATSTHVPDELHPAIVGAPPTTVATPPTIEETSTAQLTTPSQEATGPTNTETTPTENAAPQDAAASPPAAAGETSLSQPASNEQGTHERPEGREDEESQDGGESSDEEERPYWADFVEDTSMPSERELKLIEEDGQENDALDCKCYMIRPIPSLIEAQMNVGNP